MLHMKPLHTALVFASLLMLLVVSVEAQKRMTIQATAKGTSTQAGRIAEITIIIEDFSTPEDQKALADAFNKNRQDGLVSVLEHMKPKGRIRFSSGGVGNDIKHIIELPSKNGRRLRLVTDRDLAFVELRNTTRSEQYSVGGIELTLTPDGKGEGTLLPACKLTFNKKKQQIELETYQNPWKLDNFIIHNE